MKKNFLLLGIVVIFICAGCGNVTKSEAVLATEPEPIQITAPETIPTTKGVMQMTDKEKKEKFDAIENRIKIEFSPSMEILEIETDISDTEFSTIYAIFRVNQQDMEAIYEQIDKQNKEELYQWEKWLKSEKPYFPKRLLYLVEDREDYVFFKKTTPGRGKGANVAYFLILPEESDNSYIIYFSYGGE